MTTVLLLEDDPGIRKLLTYLLTRNNFRVLAADTLSLALAYTATDKVDIIVAELEECPARRYNWQRIERLQRAAPAAPIVVCTIYHEATRDQDIPATVTAIITKPFQPFKLMTTVMECLRPTAP